MHKINPVNWSMPGDVGHIKFKFLISVERLLGMDHSLTRASRYASGNAKINYDEDVWIDEDGNLYSMW